jgi:hypothetical protein
MLGVAEVKPQKPEMKLLTKERGMRIEEVKIAIDGDFGAQVRMFFARRPVAQGSDHCDSRREAERGRFRRNNRRDDDGGMVARPVVPRCSIGDCSNGGTPCGSPLCLKAGGADRWRMLWRLGYIVGKTLVGMEVEQVIAITDYLTAQPEIDASQIGLWGLGQGGMTALYAAAIDERLADATVQDYFRQREESWKEPVGSSLVWPAQRVWDAEVAALIAPRVLTIITRSAGLLGGIYRVHSEADKIRMCQYLLTGAE